MPRIHPRTDWNARKPRGTTPLTPSKVRYIAVHWPGSKGKLPVADVAKQLRGWQDYHMDGRGWRDIAYSEAVDLNGEIWTLRGDNADGSVANMGGKVYSILAVYGTADTPTDAMKATIAERVALARKKYPNAKVVGHRDLKSTDCPGSPIYSWLKQGMPLDPVTPTDPTEPETGIPDFPLPKGSYFGPKEGPAQSVSGYYDTQSDGTKGHDGLYAWQVRADELGHNVGTPDGLYGPLSASAARAIQTDAGIEVDGLIGKDTWYATWADADEAEPEEPEAPSIPAPSPAGRAFRFGQANWQSERWGGLDDSSPSIGQYMRDEMRASVYALCEVTEERRNAIRKVLGAARYLVYPFKYVAVLWDSTKWAHKAITAADKISFGTSYHGAIRVTLTDKEQGAGDMDVIAMHARPTASFGNVSEAAVVAGKQGDIKKALGKLLRKGVPTIVAADFNTGTAFDVAKKYGLVRATPAVDTVDKAGDQKLDAIFVTPDLIIRGQTLMNPGNRSDHRVWLANLTLNKKG